MHPVLGFLFKFKDQQRRPYRMTVLFQRYYLVFLLTGFSSLIETYKVAFYAYLVIPMVIMLLHRVYEHYLAKTLTFRDNWIVVKYSLMTYCLFLHSLYIFLFFYLMLMIDEIFIFGWLVNYGIVFFSDIILIELLRILYRIKNKDKNSISKRTERFKNRIIPLELI